MEKEQWTSKNQQAVAMESEGTEEYLNGGITNLLESEERNSNGEKSSNIQNNVDKNSKIQEVVEAAISEMSRKTIDEILEQVKTLTPIEHLLLYLKLPTEYTNLSDPLRQPLNPLGSRSEINQTIMWIKTHLEEDPELSLPKQDVYNEYYCYCGPNKIKPLSTADFGKVMKQVYPRVRPRRLGTRGNSRYCYAGLRRRLKLDSPILPDLTDKPQSSEIMSSSSDLAAASWTIVKKWSELQLGLQFSSLQALACYLVLNLSIGNGTEEANVIISATKRSYKGDVLSTNNNCTNRHRETQLQLQRKIQQKSEVHREQKRKMQQIQSPRIRSKKCKLQANTTPVSPLNTSPSVTTSDINISPPQSLQPVCDKLIDFNNLQTLPDFSSFQKTVNSEEINEYPAELQKQNDITNELLSTSNPIVGKLPIPRLNSNISKFITASSPKKGKSTKYKAIQPKSEPCDIDVYNQQLSVSSAVTDIRSQKLTEKGNISKLIKRQKIAKKQSQDASYKPDIDNNLIALDVESNVRLPRERLISIAEMDKSALDDYLGTSSSQEHEEELVKYFENKDSNADQEECSKLSQLRQILMTQNNNMETNFTCGLKVENEDIKEGVLNLTSLLNTSTSSAFTKMGSLGNSNDPANSNLTYHKANDYTNNNNNLYINARRRVSFDVIQQEDCTVPPSPNTRRKNFNFTPISPGRLSPNGVQSKCSSTTASPFVSPRNTPVPRAKGNSNYHPSVSNSFIVNLANSNLPVNTRKQVMLPKINTKIKSEMDEHNEGERINIHTNGCNEVQSRLIVTTEINNYLPMSAPASPKFSTKLKNSNFLQKLLNSNNKVTYSPNYSHSQNLPNNIQDPLSNEISQLFNKNISESTDSNYRSQSVPLHQMYLKTNSNLSAPAVPNSYNSQFSFVNTISGIESEFNDFDSFSNNENINMNKILSSLDTNEILPTSDDNSLNNVIKVDCNEIPLESSSVFNNTLSMDQSVIESNLVPPNSQDSFDQTECIDFNQQNIKLSANSLPTLRMLGRSLSIDIESNAEINYATKYPSRSVPGTPIPSCSKQKSTSKNYRSYPSTPLAINETFSYNQSHDCLLNGQPIKDKIADNSDVNPNIQFFQTTESNEEIFNNVDMFSVNDTNLNCDGYNFEGNFVTKQNIASVLGDSNVINDNDYDLKNISNSNAP